MINIVIAIPTANRGTYIRKLLTCLASQGDRVFSTVILNDGADPGTRQAVKQMRSFLPNVFYIESPEASGLPRARNQILDFVAQSRLHSGSAYIVFLDDDVSVKEDFVQQVKKYALRFDAFCFRMEQKGSSATFDLTKFPRLQRLLSPMIGSFIAPLGIMYGGFYTALTHPRRVRHVNGGCLIYNFSKNPKQRFDLHLNEGNHVAEDTCFTYELHRARNRLAYIGTYSYIHEPQATGGCRMVSKGDAFYWYWKHKLYIIAKHHGKLVLASAWFFSLLESVALSLVFDKHLTGYFLKATHAYGTRLGHNGRPQFRSTTP